MNAPAVVDLVLQRDPSLGKGRLLCIDGPAGSGKTTLAAEVAALTGATLIRMDDLYPGWSGLFAVGSEVLGLLEPLSRGLVGSYRRYDWDQEAYAEEHTVVPTDLIVLEGVGAGNRAWAHWSSALVWVETDDETRMRRALARDGEHIRAHLLAWREDEGRLYAEERTRERADLRLTT